MRYRWKQFWVTVTAFVLCLCLLPDTAAAQSRKVRVGYMDTDGFIMKDANGGFRGYGVDYLNKIAYYTGWEYEYVYSTWDEQLKLLERGELDLICNAQYTRERAGIYGYPDYPIGQEATVIYARPDDVDIYYEDYAAMDGKKIGLMRASFQNRNATRLENKYGISLDRVYYDSSHDIIEALTGHEVDLALLGGLALHEGLKVVAQFGADPFYLITDKGDPALLAELNDALEQINSFSPYFEQELYQKYYGGATFFASPLLTREEHAYLLDCPPVKIGCIEGFVPLCYRNEETGSADGILPALVTAAAQKSGLPIEIILLKDTGDIMEYLYHGEVDLLAGVVYKMGMDVDRGITVSEPLLDETLVMIARSGSTQSVEGTVRIALPNQLSYLAEDLLPYFPQNETGYYHSVEDCIDSVVSGDADITLQNDYVANYYLQKKTYQTLTATSFLEFDDPLAIAGEPGIDRRVISIINKSIPCISPEERAGILTRFTIAKPYRDSIGDTLWYYRYIIGIIAILLITLIVVSTLLRNRRIKIKRARTEAETYKRISERDILTGVYNRQMFYARARELLDQNPETLYQFIYLNIENFKLFNDLLGTEEGDRILTRIAGWAKEYAHAGGGVAGRLDSDHFILCVPSKEEQGELVVQLLSQELKKDLADMDITVNCGVYTAVDRTKKIQLMCDRAHLAANDSKGNVMKPVTYYSSAHRERLMQKQTVLNEMRSALAGHQFQIYLQPQIGMENGRLIGAEALVRWIHPERGVIPPAQFIPVFEQNGFITSLDLYVFEEVCKLQKRWREEGREAIPVSVNLSRVNFYSRTLREQLLRILEMYEVKPELVELELTESAYAVDDHEVYSRLQKLQSDGFRILMDDFGSGYSSLNMLKEAPVDILKLDLRFLYQSDPYQRSWQILKSILSMAQELGIPVIAEGVETKEQMEVLAGTGCYAAQGYYHSRPVEVAVFEEKYLN